MTEATEPAHPLHDILRILDLGPGTARTTEDIFTGLTHSTPNGRIYGGQVVAQATIAAQRTVPEDRVLHSLHGYFLRPGDITQGITLAVDRIHDGRSFSTRRSQAYQKGVPIWSMIASFQTEDPGAEYTAPMPSGIPMPEDLPDDVEHADGAPEWVLDLLRTRPIEVRHVEQPLLSRPGPIRTGTQHVWIRMKTPLPDDAALHRAALAYMSDTSIMEPVMRATGLYWGSPGLSSASLDHAMWWHRFARADDWLLYVQDSSNARGGRGLATGRMYTRDGMLVATVAQEVMIRVPDIT